MNKDSGYRVSCAIMDGYGINKLAINSITSTIQSIIREQFSHFDPANEQLIELYGKAMKYGIFPH